MTTCGAIRPRDFARYLDGLTCSRRPGHPGNHANRGNTWADVCRCREVTFEVGRHATCMNCGGHNPRCAGAHCQSHPHMLALGTLPWTGATYCRLDS